MENNSIKILIIDDNAVFAKRLSATLESENFSVIQKPFSNQIRILIEEVMPTTILVDDEITSNAQFNIYSMINLNKKLYQIPYVIIANEYNLQNHIKSLEFGANDYFEKTIDIQLLTTRIKSLVTKYAVLHPQKEITIGKVTINQASRIVYKNNQPVLLLNREYQILALLANNPNNVFSHSQILQRILGTAPHINTNSVSVHICGIRNKLGLKELITIKGGGYKLELNTK